ncbi:DUF1410 domain-containing protein [Ureaplasma canigenitalium]|uniref:DUF1410 domain-containing protein n=1 Tax=Ureaplasma canigenitalium TaxID=42092 RepID=UPI0004E19828|nr:DUF1410 domain-containing protein [Ureaplasma canigenitalium]
MNRNKKRVFVFSILGVSVISAVAISASACRQIDPSTAKIIKVSTLATSPYRVTVTLQFDVKIPIGTKMVLTLNNNVSVESVVIDDSYAMPFIFQELTPNTTYQITSLSVNNKQVSLPQGDVNTSFLTMKKEEKIDKTDEEDIDSL